MIALRASAGDDGVADYRTVRSQLGAEVVARHQVDWRADAVGGGVACSHCALSIQQGQGTASTAGRNGLVDVDVAVRIQRERVVGAPTNCVVHSDIAVAHCGAIEICAAVGAGGRLNGDTVAAQQVAQSSTRDIPAACCDGEVHRVEQPRAGQSRSGGGRNFCAIGNGHMRATGFNKPTISPIRCAGIQRAAHFNAVVVHAAQQVNLALPGGYRLRANLTAVVHHRGHHGVQALGGQHHQAAIRIDGLFVFHQRVQAALVDADTHQRVAIEVQADLVARCQDGCAQAGRDHAFVFDLVAQQRHIAAVCRVDRAQVDDAGLAGVGSKGVAPGHKVGIAQVQRGGHQATHVDAGSAGEQHAVGVEQKHLAIGVHGPGNHRLLIADHAVEDHGRCIGLHEVHRGRAADREALPVDGRALAALVDGERVGRAADGSDASADLSAGGQGIDGDSPSWHCASSY